MSLKDEVKYGITYGRDASNVATDSLLRVLQRDAYEVYRAHFDLPEFSVGLRGASWEEWEDVPYIEGGNVWREVDLKRYELKDHLGNVRVIVSDLRRAKLVSGVPTDFTALIKHYSNYYPFGMEKPGMVWDKGGYRYGFNGKENDDEVSGVGNHQDYGMRVYDPRLAKFLSVDPLTKSYPFYSPYHFAGNTPIWAIDLDGAEPDFTTDEFAIPTEFPEVTVQEMNHGENILFNNMVYTHNSVMEWSGANLAWQPVFTVDDIYVTANRMTVLEKVYNMKDRVSVKLTGKANIISGAVALKKSVLNAEMGTEVSIMETTIIGLSLNDDKKGFSVVHIGQDSTKYKIGVGAQIEGMGVKYMHGHNGKEFDEKGELEVNIMNLAHFSSKSQSKIAQKILENAGSPSVTTDLNKNNTSLKMSLFNSKFAVGVGWDTELAISVTIKNSPDSVNK